MSRRDWVVVGEMVLEEAAELLLDLAMVQVGY